MHENDENSKKKLRQELAESYLGQIHRIRDTLDEIEDLFVENPVVDINIYRDFEKEVIDVGKIYSDKFVDAFKNNDFKEMQKLHVEVIDAIIELAQKITP